MNFIALLPMKEHSERIPEKNFRMLDKKPLFFYIADTLKTTNIFKKIIINTDSHKIVELAKNRYKDWVHINKRTKNLCGDYVSMNEIIDFDIQNENDGYHFFQTHSTNPFLQSEVIKEAVSQYKKNIINNNYDSLFSVNVLYSRLYNKSLIPINHDPSKLIRTQDLDITYEENSNFYMFSKESFKIKNARIGINPFPFTMKSDRITSLDIDFPEDWDFAEELIRGGRIKIN